MERGSFASKIFEKEKNGKLFENKKDSLLSQFWGVILS